MRRLIGFVKPGGGMRVFDVSDRDAVCETALPAQRPEDNPVSLVRDFNMGYVKNVVNFEFLRRARDEGDAKLMATLKGVARKRSSEVARKQDGPRFRLLERGE